MHVHWCTARGLEACSKYEKNRKEKGMQVTRN